MLIAMLLFISHKNEVDIRKEYVSKKALEKCILSDFFSVHQTEKSFLFDGQLVYVRLC